MEEKEIFTLDDLTEKAEGERTDIALGTVYELNKTVIANQKTLSNFALEEKKQLVVKFTGDTDNNYYMLLSNENKDYTIFKLTKKTLKKRQELASVLIDECLKNRGDIKAIDMDNLGGAIEIWMMIDNQPYVYYFFPYDAALVEI